MSKTVGLMLYEGCTLLDFVGATQVFTQWASGWNPVWIAAGPDPVATSELLQVVPNQTFDSHDDLDVVFVPGGGGNGVAAAMGSDDHLAWLRGVTDDDTWVGSVCVGTFILAAAGLLDGATVTTHWRLLDQLRRLAPTYGMTVAAGYPRAVLDRDKRRFSGGGVSSSIDLALTLVRDMDGADKATAAALVVQYAPELPDGVPPGSPDTTNPEVLERVENEPALLANFVEPIAAAARKFEEPDPSRAGE